MKRNNAKWILCGLLAAAGLFLSFCLVGYRFSGLILLMLAALVPVYHFLKHDFLRRVLTALLLLGFVAMSITGGVIARSAEGTSDPEADYLIVLGAGVHGTRPSLSLRERIDAAYVYLLTYPDAVAIVSGGQGGGEDITEAMCMYRELTAMGISPDRILREENAATTLENLRFSMEFIEPGASVAIVSSEYHLHRAGMFAGSLGLEPKLVPAHTSYPVLRTNYYLREIFAVWYYSLFGG